MMWDMFCRAVESIKEHRLLRHEMMSELEDIARESHLFIVPENPPPMKEELSFTEFIETYEDFSLPFRVTAVVGENQRRLIILDDVEPGASGMDHERVFVYLAKIDKEVRRVAYEKAKEVLSPTEAERMFTDTVVESAKGIMAIGVCKAMAFNDFDKMSFGFSGHKGFLVGDKGVLAEIDIDRVLGKENTHERNEVGLSLGSAFYFLAVLNDKNLFVLRETPKRVRDPRTSKKIPRQHERPKYTIVTAKEARETMRLQLPKGVGGKKSPHERRGHKRWFRDDRFKKKKGQYIWIEAFWIGDSEAKVGNKMYKLML